MEYIDLYAYSGGVYVHDANLTEVCWHAQVNACACEFD